MATGSDRTDVGIVLVHGAELGAWVWERVLPLLPRTAVALDLPGRGSRPARGRSVAVADGVAAIVDAATQCGADRVVLVVHSFSGVLAPAAVAALGGRVAAVVFLGAAVPREGRSWLDLQPPVQRLFLRALYRVRPDGVRSPEAQNRKMLCNDLDDATTAAFLERLVPEPPGLLLGAVSPAILPAGLARHYVVLTDDRSATPATRDEMVRRLGDATIHRFPSGHLPCSAGPRNWPRSSNTLPLRCKEQRHEPATPAASASAVSVSQRTSSGPRR